MSERSLLIGAAIASFLQPAAFLTLDYILVRVIKTRRPLYEMLRCGETLCQCSHRDHLSGFLFVRLIQINIEFRFYGDQDLFLNLPLRSSSKVQQNSDLHFAESLSRRSKETSRWLFPIWLSPLLANLCLSSTSDG